MLTRAAYLRIYLEASDAERSNGGEEVPSFDLTELGILGERPDADDLVTEWAGRKFICPNNVRIRMLEGVLAFYNAYTAAGGSLIIPESVAQRAAGELERLYALGPHARSYILTSAWFVPLRWFVPFQPTDREVLGDGEVEGIRYRTLASDAGQRLDRALQVMRDAGLDDSVVGQVEELQEWISGFPGRAMIELDYGTVASLFTSADLVLDETAADIWASIEALERADFAEAGEHYATAASRWAPAMAVTYSN